MKSSFVYEERRTTFLLLLNHIIMVVNLTQAIASTSHGHAQKLKEVTSTSMEIVDAVVIIDNKKSSSYEEVERIQRINFARLMRGLVEDVREFYVSIDGKRRGRMMDCNDEKSTVFILDWDDTCCATSWLSVGPPGVFVEVGDDGWMEVLEMRVLSLLKRGIMWGRIVIVTNAGEGWVEFSAQRWMPAVGKFLKSYKGMIKVVSARERYERVFGRDVGWMWKHCAFFDELMEVERIEPVGKGRVRNVIVLGDSMADQYAAHAACGSLRDKGVDCKLKVVKFLDQPSVEQLCKELTALLDHLEAMVCYKTAFDVAMYKEPIEQARRPCAIDHNSEALTPPS